jgi:hypothetical protein
MHLYLIWQITNIKVCLSHKGMKIEREKREPDLYPPILLEHLLQNHAAMKTSRQCDTQFSLHH